MRAKRHSHAWYEYANHLRTWRFWRGRSALPDLILAIVGAAVAAHGVAVVAAFAELVLDHAVPTAFAEAARRGTAGATGLRAGVTLFAEQAVDLAVAAIASGHAARSASGSG